MFSKLFWSRHVEPSPIPRDDIEKAVRQHCTPSATDEKTHHPITMFSNLFWFRHVEPSLIPRDDIEKALRQHCTPSPPDEKTGERPPISDGAFLHIANLLKHLEKHLNVEGYHKVPRTYTVLRNIDCQDLLPEFIRRDLADIAFPYTFEKLPDLFLDDLTRSKFLKAQKYVLTDATRLEHGPEGHHASTKNGDDLFHVIRLLGNGGYGSVDEVFSRLSFKHYARKRFLRKKNARDDQIVLKMFEKEVSSLKRLSHDHLVRVIGSYTDQKCVAFLMIPVADCNLMVYLSQPRAIIDSHLPSIRSYFGCLANAVAYLHRQRIRHRDLKPQNILIKEHVVFIADFGSAHDWSKMRRDTTEDLSTPATEKYMAPELSKRSPRNSASDMWSLGVVFVEMATVLRGRTMRDFDKYLETNGSRHPYVWGNPMGMNGWLEELRRVNVSPDNEAIEWVKDLTHVNPKNRPQASELTRQIRNRMHSNFIGICCKSDDETENWSSPSTSVTNEEFEESCMGDFGELCHDVKPFGSLIEPSKQASVEDWISHSTQELQTSFLPSDGDDSHYLTGVKSNISKGFELSADFLAITSLSNSKIVDQGTGYDVVEDDSDREYFQEDSDREDGRGAGQGYEIMDDSSGSEKTVRPSWLSETTQEKPFDDKVDADDDQKSKFSEQLSDLLPGDPSPSQAICNVLDAMPDNDAAPGLEDTQRSRLSLSENKQPKSIYLPKVENSAASSTNPSVKPEEIASEVLPDIEIILSETISPNECSNEWACQSRLKDSSETENLDNITLPSLRNPINNLSKQNQLEFKHSTETKNSVLSLTDHPNKSIKVVDFFLPDAEAVVSELIPADERSGEPSSQSRLENPHEINNFDEFLTEKEKKKKKKTEKKHEDSKNEKNGKLEKEEPEGKEGKGEKVTNSKTKAQISTFSSQNSSSKVRPEALTAENLAKVTRPSLNALSQVNELKRQEDKPGIRGEKSEQRRKKPKSLNEESEISADKYMKEVWEAASSAPTSVLSSKTRELFKGFRAGMVWVDKTEDLVTKYAKAGKPSAVNELLKAGCNPGTKKTPRYRPLIYAVQGQSQRHNRCVAILLRHQANPNAYNPKTKKTALHLAIENNDFHGYTNLIRDLLDAGADPNAIDSNGDSPLLQILYGGYKPLEKHKRDALACLLQKHSATDVNVVPPGTQNMPLHLAIRRKDPWAVAFIVHRGAKLNEPNGAGITPLMLAAETWSESATNGQIEILRSLLNGGVDIQERSRDSQMSALDIAVSSGCERAVRLLIEKIERVDDIQLALSWAKKNEKKISSEAHSTIMMLLSSKIGVELSVLNGESAIATVGLK